MYRGGGVALFQRLDSSKEYTILLGKRKWDYPKVCVNLQTEIRYNYSVWRLFLCQEEKTAQKKWR